MVRSTLDQHYKLERGKVFLEQPPLDLAAHGLPNGPARLYFRPHDVEVGTELPGAISGVVLVLRPRAGTRRVDLTIEGVPDRVEIELPAGYSLARSLGADYCAAEAVTLLSGGCTRLIGLIK